MIKRKIMIGIKISMMKKEIKERIKFIRKNIKDLTETEISNEFWAFDIRLENLMKETAMFEYGGYIIEELRYLRDWVQNEMAKMLKKKKAMEGMAS